MSRGVPYSSIEYIVATAKNGPAPGMIPNKIPAPIPNKHHNILSHVSIIYHFDKKILIPFHTNH